MEIQQSDSLLLPQEVLLSAGVHIGTRVKTNDMVQFIYKVRPDGLFVLDMDKMNKRVMTAAKFISMMDISRLVVASSKRYGRLPVHKFCEVTGAHPLIGRFTSGTFTNPTYSHYFEPVAVLVTDALADKQIVVEATAVGVPVIALCSTDNNLSDVDLAIPINNKGRRSLAIAYWLLARQLKRELNELTPEQEFSFSIDDFESTL
ncbi:30S ribosomal protein S2 [Candidatus Bathyarchaeota archaeon]|jgi:small subunit ribosomal protein S2|nr:30S ribosomal protein S2 [Candidatus Bathyarchaeota archaeon]MDP6048143.1 30S ribosomal protein S2 [Candidatus Bathyarchaeota archaeon]MDP7443548.1 30S ribosomal protein S2 [Candidatus Bathyarchaeota archaeon]|tara:strand:+ start:1080 stop:1691 length:612 start_codon:yes stop_codon:yes gene_type:complete